MDTFKDDVYPKSKYFEESNPFCLYIPNKEIMFKMIRACIKVTEPEDLWINA